MTVANPSSIPRIRILVVRHGETQQNVERIIQGQLDTDLNSRGRDQARRTAEALKDETIDEIYASPLRRAKDVSTLGERERGSEERLEREREKRSEEVERSWARWAPVREYYIEMGSN